ncbi:TetR/AcrR family transcriptional regulator [Actinoplanes sp. TBRC 11911]|uniref:TetR/AcrR family transcriptional regulator n=1 Tax=Actinoplanes sp. TBRC 11911 TaxID=2729386 RepID=UPI00145D6A28|nr:TetR/AcrR family transcriptional regulator [Actinoplanes sp. TBRC 11911]NMO53290.1 TetR/AcrR family transcriptional regulator [Actinoplanes sp. TBRC 11911]
MPRRAAERSGTRQSGRLTREGIVAAAVDLADADGLASLSMRRLAQHLGVDPMSIYYHVRDKDTLLAEMVDAVAASIGENTQNGRPWTDQLRELIMQARRTMLTHPWAARVLEAQDNPTPAVLAHIEKVLAIMRAGGCSVDLSHHALHLFGSRLMGFSQDLFNETAQPPATIAQMEAMVAALPHISELAGEVSHTGALGVCDDDAEFAFVLDLLLEGLERRRLRE